MCARNSQPDYRCVALLLVLAGVLASGCSSSETPTGPNAIAPALVSAAANSLRLPGVGQIAAEATVIPANETPLAGKKAVSEATDAEPSNFEITAPQDEGNGGTGQLEELVDPAAMLIIKASPKKPAPGKKVTFTVTAYRGTGKKVKGQLEVKFGDGNTELIKRFKNGATLGHTYEDGGSFNMRATLTEPDGSKTKASREVVVKTKGGGIDELDPKSVIWLDTNITKWSITSTITKVDISSSQICISHTKSGQWPVSTTALEGASLEGNPWVIAKIGGQWYGATYEWLKPGQTCKGIAGKDFVDQINIPPMSSWTPKSGDQVGFVVTTIARLGKRTSDERTQIVLVVWP
ncbi:MAG: PKD domain-containing protein [Acidobacteriota bacterium]